MVSQGEGHSKDYDFSRTSMEEHWRAGYYDAVRTLPRMLPMPGHCALKLECIHLDPRFNLWRNRSASPAD
jgi:hypothetical protein